MTDKEIINNIERCIENDCDNCTWMEQTACKEYMLHDALDLINRQQKLIERLLEEAQVFKDIGKMYSEVKADIRKEFVERLKEITKPFLIKENGLYLLNTQDIKDILEEVVGENNG